MRSGKLFVYFGPMFSGKTTVAMSQLNKRADIGMKSLYINSILDTRTIGNFSTHSSHGGILSSKVNSVKTKFLFDQTEIVKNYDVIAIDEAQFFEDLLNTVITWVDTLGKIVIVCGLDGDSNRRKFGHILDLIPYADVAEKITAKCRQCLVEEGHPEDSSDAPFTYRLNRDVSQILIGNDEVYSPLCRFHYLKLSAEEHSPREKLVQILDT